MWSVGTRGQAWGMWHSESGQGLVVRLFRQQRSGASGRCGQRPKDCHANVGTHRLLDHTAGKNMS